MVKHVVEVVDDTARNGWSPARVEDTLSIAARPNGRLWISVTLVQGNAHMCLLDGLADYTNGEIVYRSDDPGNQAQDSNADPEAPCEVRVRVSETDGLTLSVPDAAQQGCRWFCGARATLDGAVFPWRTTPGARMPKVP